MSLFDKYNDEIQDIPDNEKVFIRKPRKYKDKIVLGGTNNHSFLLPGSLTEIKQFSITYSQGTEIKLTKTFYGDLFTPSNEADDVKEYTYIDGSKLYELTKDEVKEVYLFDEGENQTALSYCIIFYEITPEESLVFNNWNREVYVQARVVLNYNNTKEEGETVKYSNRYKIKIVKTINDRIPNYYDEE